MTISDPLSLTSLRPRHEVVGGGGREGRRGEGSFCRYRANICNACSTKTVSGSASVSGSTVKITKISRNCKMKLKHLGANIQLSSGNN